MGHSIGGQMGSMLVSRYHNLIDGFILNASCTVYYKAWGKAAGIGLLFYAALINFTAKILGYYPGNFLSLAVLKLRALLKIGTLQQLQESLLPKALSLIMKQQLVKFIYLF
jgi:hypothetical protein